MTEEKKSGQERKKNVYTTHCIIIFTQIRIPCVNDIDPKVSGGQIHPSRDLVTLKRVRGRGKQYSEDLQSKTLGAKDCDDSPVQSCSREIPFSLWRSYLSSTISLRLFVRSLNPHYSTRD